MKTDNITLQDVQYRTSKENYNVAIFNQLCEDAVKSRRDNSSFIENIRGNKVVFEYNKKGYWTATRIIRFAGSTIRKVHIFFIKTDKQ